ncbi:MAG: 2,3-bisphosphoglycerate-independent phosphoglycerate mutase, partial [Halobacteriales archaeon]
GPTDDPEHRNVVAAAETPNVDRFADAGAYGELSVSGRDVGLPAGQMGNSEVGHLNLGAGRVVKQEYTRIEDAIAAGELVSDGPIDRAFRRAEETGGRVHLLGLVSDGGVHSDYEHAFALIEAAADRRLEAVTHAFTDGRDTPPESGSDYLRDLEEVAAAAGTGAPATVSGRYYAMDRDRNWERTRRAYDAIVERDADHVAASGVEAVEQSYDRGTTDEFVEPTLIEGRPALAEGDAAIFFNFRADRARQLTRMLSGNPPEDGSVSAAGVEWPEPPAVELVTMTEYDKTFDLPAAFPPHQPEHTLGEVLEAAGRTQLRIAESEKYAHVTYFFNGGREVEFDGEIRRIVESPDVPTYDHQPEMSAPEVTDTAIDVVEREDPDVLVLNYANPDMVGHTGDYEAAVAAVEAVDRETGRLVSALQAAGSHVLLTADHGNAEDMGTAGDPHTAHTYNDVPFVYLAAGCLDGEVVGDCTGGRTVRAGGRLADVAPTMLELLGLSRPAAMTGESLVT